MSEPAVRDDAYAVMETALDELRLLTVKMDHGALDSKEVNRTLRAVMVSILFAFHAIKEGRPERVTAAAIQKTLDELPAVDDYADEIKPLLSRDRNLEQSYDKYLPEMVERGHQEGWSFRRCMVEAFSKALAELSRAKGRDMATGKRIH